MSELRPELQLLLDAPGDQKPIIFFGYCQEVIRAKNEGHITLEDAGYQIADTVFVRELDEPLFAEITSLAGRLELPFHTAAIDPDAQWEYFVALVLEYGARLTDDSSR